MTSPRAYVLNPSQRNTLIEALKPPRGYQLADAIGTTYTLDLLTLLTTPLAFTLFEYESGSTGPDPLAILNAMREYASRISLFCQAGRIQVPAQQRSLFLHLEETVHEVRAPTENGVFHPKVWLIKYVADGAPAVFRLLCSSRNLTFDKSWDTLLVLDGELTDRQNVISSNRPLANFFRSLPNLTLRGPSEKTLDRVNRLAWEVERVQFEPPEGVDELAFWPLGHGGHVDPFQSRVDRMLVVSPFVTPSRLQSLPGKNNVLVSRLEELSRHDLSGVDLSEVYSLSQAAEPEPSDDVVTEEDSEGTLHGLHAKLYVADAGWDAHVWTGSANATHNAFHRNVEFLIQLSGKKSKLGIDVVLGSDTANGLRALLEPFHATKGEPDVESEAMKRLDDVRLELALSDLRLVASKSESVEETYTLHVRGAHDWTPPEDVRIHCWPVTLPTNRQASLGDADDHGTLATFLGLSPHNVTTFLAFELQTQGHATAFVLNLPIDGAPSDRHERVLGELLKDKDSVLRLILLLLADPDDPANNAYELLQVMTFQGKSGAAGASPQIPLLETMLRALSRDPTKLDPVARLVADLQNTDHDLLPEGLDDVWNAIWTARNASAP